jgi:hypothetical protein
MPPRRKNRIIFCIILLSIVDLKTTKQSVKDSFCAPLGHPASNAFAFYGDKTSSRFNRLQKKHPL